MRLHYRVAAVLVSVAAGLGPVATTMTGTAAAAAGTAGTARNLIRNGSFERPDCSPSFCEFDKGSTAIPHWTVGGNSVDLVYSAYFHAARGHQSVDLSGSAPGSVRQRVATRAGRRYVLKWFLAGNPVCGQKIKKMHVYWDGKLVDSVTFNTRHHSATHMGWVPRQIRVRAKGRASVVRFADATPDHSECGAALDAVSLVRA
jgi:choice-of-anchor C domain-containing protein